MVASFFLTDNDFLLYGNSFLPAEFYL